MKITPLAAFLIMAPAAMAQSPAFPAASPFGGAPSALTSGGRAVISEEDMIFKCSTPPYIACTSAQLARRDAIRMSGKCPLPASKACMDYLMTHGEGNAVQFLGNQSNPATANDGIAAKCGTAPYRDCSPKELKERELLAQDERAARAEWEQAHQMMPPKKGDIELVGPPEPHLPAAFDPKDFQGALTFARATQGAAKDGSSVVDLGGNRYGIVQSDGQVRVCGSGMKCGEPHPASEFPDLAARIQEASSFNSGAKSLNAGNPTGAPKGAKTASPSADPTETSADPSDDAPSSAARGLGAEIAGEQGALAKGFGADAASDVGPTEAEAGAKSGAAKVATVSADAVQAQLATDGFTYIKINQAAKTSRSIIQGGAATFSPNTNRPAEPVVDEKNLGKIKASENTP